MSELMQQTEGEGQTCYGLHISVFRDIAKEAREGGLITIAQVCDRLIKEKTEAKKCSFADQLPTVKDLKGPANVMTCQSWDLPFEQLLQALETYEELSKNSFFWVDAFMYNLHDMTLRADPSWWRDVLMPGIQGMDTFVLILSPWHSTQVTKSSECLFEIMVAMKAGLDLQTWIADDQTQAIVHSLMKGEVDELLKFVEVSFDSSTCFEEGLDNGVILQAVRDSVGFEHANKLVDEVISRWFAPLAVSAANEFELIHSEEDEYDKGYSILCDALAGVVTRAGEAKVALPMYRNAVSVGEAKIGFAEAAAMHIAFGDAFAAIDELEEALHAYDKALSITLQMFGETVVEAAQAYKKIGSVHEAKSRYLDAISCYEKAYDIFLRVEGKNHKSTAECLNRLAIAHFNKGNADDAMSYAEKALQTFSAIHARSRWHRDISEAHNNIGMVLVKRERYEEAKEQFEKALEINLEVLGKLHSSTANMYYNLADLADLTEEPEMAIEYLETALNIDVYVRGEDHKDVAYSFDRIAAYFHEHENREKALENFKRALNIKLQVLGANNLETAKAFNNVGVQHTFLKDYDAAIHNLNQAFKIKRALLGDDDDSTMRTRANLLDIKKRRHAERQKRSRIRRIKNSCPFM